MEGTAVEGGLTSPTSIGSEGPERSSGPIPDPEVTVCPSADPHAPVTTTRPASGAGPRLLRTALARGRLPLGTLRLTILRAVDDALRARDVPAEDRRTGLDRIGRFLADHVDRRHPPSGEEVHRWARELVRRERATEEEAAACLRTVRFLYTRVLGRWQEEPSARSRSASPRPLPHEHHSGPITGAARREDGRCQ